MEGKYREDNESETENDSHKSNSKRKRVSIQDEYLKKTPYEKTID